MSVIRVRAVMNERVVPLDEQDAATDLSGAVVEFFAVGV